MFMFTLQPCKDSSQNKDTYSDLIKAVNQVKNVMPDSSSLYFGLKEKINKDSNATS